MDDTKSGRRRAPAGPGAAAHRRRDRDGLARRVAPRDGRRAPPRKRPPRAGRRAGPGRRRPDRPRWSADEAGVDIAVERLPDAATAESPPPDDRGSTAVRRGRREPATDRRATPTLARIRRRGGRLDRGGHDTAGRRLPPRARPARPESPGRHRLGSAPQHGAERRRRPTRRDHERDDRQPAATRRVPGCRIPAEALPARDARPDRRAGPGSGGPDPPSHERLPDPPDHHRGGRPHVGYLELCDRVRG